MKPISMGTKTKWGKVACVMFRQEVQERYYMMLDEYGCVALLPADVAEGEP